MILLDIESELMYNNKCENNIMRNITNSIFLGCPHRFYLHPLLKIDTQKNKPTSKRNTMRENLRETAYRIKGSYLHPRGRDNPEEDS